MCHGHVCLRDEFVKFFSPFGQEQKVISEQDVQRFVEVHAVFLNVLLICLVETKSKEICRSARCVAHFAIQYAFLATYKSRYSFLSAGNTFRSFMARYDAITRSLSASIAILAAAD